MRTSRDPCLVGAHEGIVSRIRGCMRSQEIFGRSEIRRGGTEVVSGTWSRLKMLLDLLRRAGPAGFGGDRLLPNPASKINIWLASKKPMLR